MGQESLHPSHTISLGPEGPRQQGHTPTAAPVILPVNTGDWRWRVNCLRPQSAIEVDTSPLIVRFVRWLYLALLKRKDTSHTELSDKYKNKVKDLQKLKATLETYLISYGWVFFTVCWRVTAQSKASLTCFFTGDYSENKTGSQASRAWDLHEAESHLWDQCCHFVDQATQIHHARCISFAK